MRKFILGLIAAAFVAVVLSGCRSIRYVTVPEYHYETITKTDTFTQKDSIFCHDSVFMFRNGDTITISKIKYVYKDRWRDRVRIDSILKVDSVRVPYPVEKQLTKWQKMKMDFGGITFGGVLALIALCIGLIILKRRRPL